jgi:hypothetical protein
MRCGPTTPKRAGRLADASVDPTDARNAPARGKPWTRVLVEVRGGQGAIVALGHALLIVVYHVLKGQTTMSSWGPTA